MKYYPILLSKAGEFKALHELDPSIKDEISPVIEVLSGSLTKVEASLRADWSFHGNQVLLDFSNYGLISTADVAAIRTLFLNLIRAGVNVVPVVQYNSPALYIAFVQTLVATQNSKICIRASNSSNGLTGYNTKVATQMASIGTTRANTILLIDLGYAEDHNYNMLTALAAPLITGIPHRKQWADIVLASGSFPPDVSHLPTATAAHRLKRYEWDIFNTVIADPTLFGTKYGDYGNKHPIYGGESSFPGSCSVKYTIEDEFVIYRGHLAKDHAHGNGQYITFAKRLIGTPDYAGPGFSWGNLRIEQIASQSLTDPKRKPGSATSWVEITQNHHITLLHSLL